MKMAKSAGGAGGLGGTPVKKMGRQKGGGAPKGRAGKKDAGLAALDNGVFGDTRRPRVATAELTEAYLFRNHRLVRSHLRSMDRKAPPPKQGASAKAVPGSNLEYGFYAGSAFGMALERKGEVAEAGLVRKRAQTHLKRRKAVDRAREKAQRDLLREMEKDSYKMEQEMAMAALTGEVDQTLPNDSDFIDSEDDDDDNDDDDNDAGNSGGGGGGAAAGAEVRMGGAGAAAAGGVVGDMGGVGALVPAHFPRPAHASCLPSLQEDPLLFGDVVMITEVLRALDHEWKIKGLLNHSGDMSLSTVERAVAFTDLTEDRRQEYVGEE